MNCNHPIAYEPGPLERKAVMFKGRLYCMKPCYDMLESMLPFINANRKKFIKDGAKLGV